MSLRAFVDRLVLHETPNTQRIEQHVLDSDRTHLNGIRGDSVILLGISSVLTDLGHEDHYKDFFRVCDYLVQRGSGIDWRAIPVTNRWLKKLQLNEVRLRAASTSFLDEATRFQPYVIEVVGMEVEVFSPNYKIVNKSYDAGLLISSRQNQTNGTRWS